MKLTENASYIKGQIDAMKFNEKIDTTTNEGKLIEGLVDLCREMTETIEEQNKKIEKLNDICCSVTDGMKEHTDMMYKLSEYVDEIDSDLGKVEEAVFGDDEEDGDYYDEDDANHEDSKCLCDDVYDEEDLFEVTCDKCGKVFMIKSDTKAKDLKCPYCGGKITFEETD